MKTDPVKKTVHPNIFLFFLVLLFLVAPFFIQANIGGQGLNISYNISSWFIANLLIATALFLLAYNRCIYYPAQQLYLLLFVVFIVVAGLQSGLEQPVKWMFRMIYITGGVLFVFSLLQFNVHHKQVEQVLYLLVLAILLHSLLSIVQQLKPDFLNDHFQLLTSTSSSGVFRQVNLQATYLTTGIMIAFYLISRPSFNHRHALVKTLFVIAISAAAYVTISMGSRIGIISLALGSLIMFFSRRKQLTRQKPILIAILIALSVSWLLSQAGFEQALNKTANITESVQTGEYKSARLTMYSISRELIKNEPIWGHGIGSFSRVWAIETAEFLRNNPNAAVENRTLSHPHNELLFWFIEGGLVSVFAILIAFVGVCIGLYQCGSQRGGAYAAMLLPITLHTQVELPFYLSAVHWFLWLFIIFIVLRHNFRSKLVNISVAANQSIKFMVLFLCVSVSYFLIHSAQAQKDIYKFLYDKSSQPPYLKIALNNIYFRPLAEELAMKTLLYSAIDSNNKEQVSLYVNWAEQEIATNPSLMTLTDLSKAYKYLGLDSEVCRVTKLAVSIYNNSIHLRENKGFCAQKE